MLDAFRRSTLLPLLGLPATDNPTAAQQVAHTRSPVPLTRMVVTLVANKKLVLWSAARALLGNVHLQTDPGASKLDERAVSKQHSRDQLQPVA